MIKQKKIISTVIISNNKNILGKLLVPALF